MQVRPPNKEREGRKEPACCQVSGPDVTTTPPLRMDMQACRDLVASAQGAGARKQGERTAEIMRRLRGQEVVLTCVCDLFPH